MSHSAHRYGTREELQDDYVLFVRPCKKFDDASPEDRERTLRDTKTLADIVHANGALNIGRTKPGSLSQGLTYEEIMSAKAMNGFMSVFDNKKIVAEVLGALREKDTGLSVVVSGPMEDVFDICRQNGLQPHTVLCSLGIWGKTERLPSEDHLRIMTLCGHSMISEALIDDCVDQICAGSLGIAEAAQKLAKPCPCGIFNVQKTMKILEKMVADKKGGAGTTGLN
jgi:hypothetical protein